jgi:hypothetical protein
MLDALGRPSALAKVLIMKKGYPAERVTLIFVKENLGF